MPRLQGTLLNGFNPRFAITALRSRHHEPLEVFPTNPYFTFIALVPLMPRKGCEFVPSLCPGSQFYHACDVDMFGFCLLRYEVLQFCDFFSAVLSFWVTLVAMAHVPQSLASIAHVLGALGVALGVQCQRTSLWVFVAPAVLGTVLLAASWVSSPPLFLPRKHSTLKGL